MGGFAWVTLATNDSYSLGALVLAHSLKQVGTKQQLVVLITPGVTNAMREKLSQVFNLVQEVNILDSKDESNLKLLKRPELGITFTKLHCWRLTQYDKCVFLDADTLVLENCDELFEREELSAAPDVGWPDCFNSGVFVYRPSNETYNDLITFALDKGSFDGGDQGLLNLYFSDWAHKDITKHLPFIYNMCSTACYSYLPAFKQFGRSAKIVHFIGASKPWLQYFDTETKRASPSGDLQHLGDALQRWWDIFCSFIHARLSPQMIRSSSIDAQSYSQPTNNPTFNPRNDDLTQLYIESSTGDAQCVWDPWDEYDLRQQSQMQASIDDHFTHTENIEHVEPHNTNVISSTDVVHHQIHVTHLDCSDSFSDNHVPLIPTYVVQSQTENETRIDHSPCQMSVNNEQCVTVIPELDPQPNSPPYPDLIEVIEPTTTTTHSDCDHIVNVNTIQEVEEEAGLAGAFAQLTLGVPRSAEQNALEDHLRRQGWEVGNVDYLGRDSFENIWSKISETLTAPQKPEEQVPAAVVPAATDVGAPKPATEPIVPVADPVASKSEEKPAPKPEEVVQAPPAPAQTPLPETPKSPEKPIEPPAAPQTPPTGITTVAIIPAPLVATKSEDVLAEPPKSGPIPLEAPPTPQTPVEVSLPPVIAPPQVPVETPLPKTPVQESPAPQVAPVEAIPVSLTPATPTETLPTPVEGAPVPAGLVEAPAAAKVESPVVQEQIPTPVTPAVETPPPGAPQEAPQPAPPAPVAPVCPLQKSAPPAPVVKAPKTPESPAPVAEAPKTPKSPQEAPQPAPPAPAAPVCPLQKSAPPAPVAEAPKTPESPAPIQQAAPVCKKPETKTESKPSEESAACPLPQAAPVQQEQPKCPIQKKPEPSTPTEAAPQSAAGAATPTPPPRKGSGPKKGGKSKK